MLNPVNMSIHVHNLVYYSGVAQCGSHLGIGLDHLHLLWLLLLNLGSGTGLGLQVTQQETRRRHVMALGKTCSVSCAQLE